MKSGKGQFRFVGNGTAAEQTSMAIKKNGYFKVPVASICILALIIFGCLAAEWIMNHDPGYMYLDHYTTPPNHDFYFGTDTMGRDIFSMVWSGGRISLFIGFVATAISTSLAIIYGTISGTAPAWIDEAMMRFIDIILSIPSILLILFLQAAIGKQTIMAIAVLIGLNGWMGIAKVVREEVRQIRNSEYVSASKCMGGGFIHILRKHFAPGFFPAIMFMVVTNIGSAIILESTLSFIGLGLPTNVISWGSMLSLAQNALSLKAWWIILIPGFFLITTLFCITEIGNYMRDRATRKHSHL